MVNVTESRTLNALKLRLDALKQTAFEKMYYLFCTSSSNRHSNLKIVRGTSCIFKIKKYILLE